MVSPAPLKVFPERSKELSFNLDDAPQLGDPVFCGVLKSCKVHAPGFVWFLSAKQG